MAAGGRTTCNGRTVKIHPHEEAREEEEIPEDQECDCIDLSSKL